MKETEHFYNLRETLFEARSKRGTLASLIRAGIINPSRIRLADNRLRRVFNDLDLEILKEVNDWPDWGQVNDLNVEGFRQYKQRQIRREKIISRFFRILDPHLTDPNRTPKIRLIGDDLGLSWWMEECRRGDLADEKELLGVPALLMDIQQAVESLPPQVREEMLTPVDKDGYQLLRIPENRMDYVRLGPSFAPELGPESEGIIANSYLIPGITFVCFAKTVSSLVSAGVHPARETNCRFYYGDQSDLEKVTRFGKKLFSLADLGIKPTTVINYWVKRVVDHNLEVDELDTIAERILQTKIEQVRFTKNYIPERNRKYVTRYLVECYISDKIRKTNLCEFFRSNILPTSSLEDLEEKNSIEAFRTFAQLRGQTAKGNFDPGNLIQRDLEFGKYLKLLPTVVSKSTYDEFKNLKYVDSDENYPQLTVREKMEADAAAFEAAHFYLFLRERVERGRKVHVVGNQRYGSLFVVEPLKELLEELRIQTSFYHIRSSNTRSLSTPDVFPKTFRDLLLEEYPDVVIVDGTSTLYENRYVRYPRSVAGYLNWFVAFNKAAGHEATDLAAHTKALHNQPDFCDLIAKLSQTRPEKFYRIVQWLPLSSEKVVLGDKQLTLKYQQPGYSQPEAIFVNPVILPERFPNYPKELKDHKPGFLDDPEKFADQTAKIVFTRFGVQKLFSGKTEAEFIDLVQDRISKVLLETIRRVEIKNG